MGELTTDATPGELTTDATPGGSTPAATPTAASPAHDPATTRSDAPSAFEELQRNRDWWKARPEGSRLVGLVVARDDMPSVVEQRNDLARFGIAILDFKHPRSGGWATWEQRFGGMFETLGASDVLVVVSERPSARRLTRSHRPSGKTLRRHNLVVKVLSHDAPHPDDAPG